MNPKSSRKNCAKPTPKKKLIKSSKKSSEQPTSPENCEKSSKFYVSEDNEKKVVVQPEKTTVIENCEKSTTGSTLTRKLSKIYAKLSGSRENLNIQKTNNIENAIRNNEKPQTLSASPFRFQRSQTLNSIHLTKAYKRPQLEKLSEERIGEFDRTKSPSLSPPPEPELILPQRRHKSEFRQSLPPGTFDHIDFSLHSPPPDSMTILPSSPSPLQRSNSIINIFRRKVSHSNESKPEIMSSRWTASLQSLQQIDNMVSYENLSFIDYDKFNQYEVTLNELLTRKKNLFLDSVTINDANNSMVKRRVRRSGVVNSTNNNKSTSDSNLDWQKNLYRQSIDSHKLNFINDIHSDKMVEWLSSNAPTTESEQCAKMFCTKSTNDVRRRLSDDRNSINSSLRRIAESSKRKRKFRSWESLSISGESSVAGTSHDNIKMVSGQ